MINTSLIKQTSPRQKLEVNITKELAEREIKSAEYYEKLADKAKEDKDLWDEHECLAKAREHRRKARRLALIVNQQ